MPAGEDGSAPTIFDLSPDPEMRVDVRALPATAREGLRLALAAGRRELTQVIALQAVGALGILLLLLLVQRSLGALNAAGRGDRTLIDVMPWLLALAAATGLLLVAASVLRERQVILGELVGRHVEDRILDVAAAVELERHESPEFHNRVQRARMQRQQPLNLVFGLVGVTNAAIGVVGVVIALLVIEPVLVPLVALLLIPAFLVARRRGEAFYRFVWRMTPRDREREYLATLLTDRDAAKEVRAFQLAPYLRARYNHLYDERLRDLRNVARRQLTYSTVANLVVAAALAAALIVVTWLALSGRMSVAQAGVAVGAVAFAGSRLATVGSAVGSLAEAALYVEDYRAFLAQLPLVLHERPKGQAPHDFRSLEVDRVTFTYPTGTEPALVEVSLRVDEGEVVALVGENGSGKTTLAKLLARLYSPDSGVIRWDATDVSAVDPDEFRRRVAVIFQDFLRYHLSARDNVGLGRVAAIDDLHAIVQAAHHADAHDFVTALRDGYGTILGPEFIGGTDLSVGQWQRLALARAFFRDAPFVILDEPTASLDARAEHELFARIRTLLAGRTVLLISHRLWSVRSADRIYVLDAGRIVESGTHDVLVDHGGLYAELFQLQAAAFGHGENTLGAGPSTVESRTSRP